MSSVNIRKEVGLALDDVLLVPQYSEVKSRLDTDLSTVLTKGIKLGIPLCSSAMDTVTETDMAIALAKAGGIGFLHRFTSDEKVLSMVKDVVSEGLPVVASVGIREDIVNWSGILLENGATAISIDVANGHNKVVLGAVGLLRSIFPEAQIVAGNVSTAEGTRRLIEAGADAIRVGIGSGSPCSTRVITGCGVPTFTSLVECAEEASKHDIPVIQDGGIKNGGDVIKCLAAGASSCIIGRLFSKATEAPGQVYSINGKMYKEYRGMASFEAQKAFRGGLKSGTSAEGESMLVPLNGSVSVVIEELCGGVRSGMTYCGASDIWELKSRAIFMQISSTAVIESKPFGLDMEGTVH
jgi:IMP dehydrogenase